LPDETCCSCYEDFCLGHCGGGDGLIGRLDDI
jgi:hypothetical protein